MWQYLHLENEWLWERDLSKNQKKNDNMADHAKEQENYDFSALSGSSEEADTEFVIHREVLDTYSNPDDEINAGLVEKSNHDFEKLTNTFNVENHGNIEAVEDKAAIGGNEKSLECGKEGRAGKEVLVDYEEVTHCEDEIKPVGLYNDEKTQEIEFRRRCLQQQQQQQPQQKQLQRQESVGCPNEETRLPKSNIQSLKTMESETQLYQKEKGEVRLIKKAPSEEKLHDGLSSKSAL